MKILEQRILRGPNLWSDAPCVMTLVELGDESGARAVPAGWPDRAAQLACQLQKDAGSDVAFWRTARGSEAGRWRIMVGFKSEKLVLEAIDLALAMVMRTVDEAALAARLAGLRDCAERSAVGTSTAAVVAAARARGIPAFRITEEANLFQLGWGKRQQRLQATVTGSTSHVAVGIASNKQLTKTLLEQAGVPVPRGGVASSVDEALALAQRLRYPVTLKPLDGNHGKGVTTCCRDAAQVAAAYEFAREYGRRIIVERHIEGQDYRVLVTGGRIAAASLRRPPAVCGDGRSTVRQLVEAENARPERAEGHAGILTLIALDAPALALLEEQGLSPETVVPAAVQVRLRGNANLSTGGTAQDVTDQVHPDTRDLCIRAAAAIGLDVAGIDVICADIALCLRAQGGAFIEVNAAPGIRMHEYPSAPRNAGDSIVQAMFGECDGRIPVVAVTGTNGKTTTSLMIAHAARCANVATGLTTTEGVFIDGKVVAEGDCAGYHSARMLLISPQVAFAVLETARGGILKRGLAFDRCTVAVVLNVSADHLGLDGIDTVEQLAEVKAVVARSAGQALVLNADDAYCVRMAGLARDGAETFFFSMDAENSVLLRHLETGGRAAYLDEGHLVLADGQRRHRLISVDALPSAMRGHARHNVANALAAAAALMGSGFTHAQIAAGLSSFVCDFDSNPLRANVFEANGVTVIIDYAHNSAAYEALARTARALSQARVLAVVTTPGDRRDADLAELGRTCAAGFDELIAYEADPRGRPAGETAARILAGAQAAGMLPHALHAIVPVLEAFQAALDLCRPGDVLVFACGSAATAKQVIAQHRTRSAQLSLD